MKISSTKSCLVVLLAALLAGLQPVKAGDFNDWDPITQVKKENFYIYIVFGQSNAEGFAAQPLEADRVPNANLKNLVAYDNYENEDATGTNNSRLGQWEEVSEPNCRKSKRFKTACSWVKSFGEEMLAKNPGKKFGFVHVAVASAGIRLFDKDQCAAFMDGTLSGPAPDANARKKARYAYGGNPYQRIVDMARIAQQYGTVRGILLHQGEADGWKSYWPYEVKKIYGDLLKDLGLNAADVPLIIGEPTGANGAIANQDAVVTEGSPYFIRHCYKVKALDLPYIASNKLHFTRDGYMELGKRYAEQASKMLVSTGVNTVTAETSCATDKPWVTVKDHGDGLLSISSLFPLTVLKVMSVDGACLFEWPVKLATVLSIRVPSARHHAVVVECVAANGMKTSLKTVVR